MRLRKASVVSTTKHVVQNQTILTIVLSKTHSIEISYPDDFVFDGEDYSPDARYVGQISPIDDSTITAAVSATSDAFMSKIETAISAAISEDTGGNNNNNLPSANEGDALVANAAGVFESKPLTEIISEATLLTQGYYGLLSDFYFGGSASETEIDLSLVNTWVDVELDINASGLFDNRPLAMKTAQPTGHDGDGSNGNPIIFNLEGLDTRAFANFRASMAFEPEEDEGQLESRLLFNRHSNTSPSNDFPIEEVSLSMQQGANIDYVTEPMLSFFVGDTIDTNAAGDAGFHFCIPEGQSKPRKAQAHSLTPISFIIISRQYLAYSFSLFFETTK